MMEEEAEDLEVQIIILVVQVMFQAEAEVLEDILVVAVMALGPSGGDAGSGGVRRGLL